MYAFAPNLMDNVLNVAYRIMPEVPPGKNILSLIQCCFMLDTINHGLSGVDKNDVPEAKEAKLIGHLLQGVHL